MNYYFGCVERAGHYLHNENLRAVRFPVGSPPFSFREHILDGGLLPTSDDGQPQGQGHVIHFTGWTVLSFWDRSVDSRGGCSSSFVLEGKFDGKSALKRAKELFPTIFARFTFEVCIAGEP